MSVHNNTTNSIYIHIPLVMDILAETFTEVRDVRIMILLSIA